MTTPRFQFTVFGTPAGQGNLKGTRSGKLRHANGDELMEWRGKVRQAAIDFTGAHEFVRLLIEDGTRLELRCDDCGVPRSKHAEMLGAVRLEAVLTVQRPKTVRQDWPITRRTSDWDHYARALGDALTGLIWLDDSQICDGRAIVTYPANHPDSLHAPGVVIKIWPIGTA